MRNQYDIRISFGPFILNKLLRRPNVKKMMKWVSPIDTKHVLYF